jgi:hypothetical protein
MVKNPREELTRIGAGVSSKNEAIISALEVVPTVITLLATITAVKPKKERIK